MLKNARGFQKQPAQLLEGDVLCRAGEHQLSEVLGETLDLSPALQKGQGPTVSAWMAQTSPKSWEFEAGVRLLLGVNFYGLFHAVCTVCGASPAASQGAETLERDSQFCQ